MVTLDFLNNFDSIFSTILKNNFSASFLHYLSILLINITAYIYVLIKFYKVLCYSKMTFEWLPMINPYLWPFSMFQVLTGPYFQFWAKILPSVKFEKSSLEISGIIALEALNSLIFFCVRFTNMLINFLEQTEKELILENLQKLN
jgi:hypothetical protein